MFWTIVGAILFVFIGIPILITIGGFIIAIILAIFDKAGDKIEVKTIPEKQSDTFTEDYEIELDLGYDEEYFLQKRLDKQNRKNHRQIEPQVVEKIVEVVKPRTGFQKFVTFCGWFAIIFVILSIFSIE